MHCACETESGRVVALCGAHEAAFQRREESSYTVISKLPHALHLSPMPVCGRCLKAVEYAAPQRASMVDVPELVTCACGWRGQNVRISSAK